MPNASLSASASAGPSSGGSGGGNPFQLATNLYAEKNNQGAITQQLSAANTFAFGGAVNSGNYLRGVRLIVRGSGGVGGALLADAPLNAIKQISLTNVDGSDILYTMGGYARGLISKYFRPFEKDPKSAYDFSAAVANPGFTLLLKPEVRWTLGALANTDTRSQYRFDGSLALGTDLNAGYTTQPTLTVTPYMDAYAQPDQQDLQGTSNQPVPPGVNLQIKQRHQMFTLNGAGSNNILISALTGNALRGTLLVVRDQTGARVDGITDPINLQLDNRSLGKYSPDVIFQWMQDFYLNFGQSARETGVYAWPRFVLPGDMVGQSWLYTSNATKQSWEFTTAAGPTGGTVELITDEVYPVGPVDPSLVDI